LLESVDFVAKLYYNCVNKLAKGGENMSGTKKELSDIVAIIEKMSDSEKRELFALLQGMKLSKELADASKSA
jgi:hypothetical protein